MRRIALAMLMVAPTLAADAPVFIEIPPCRPGGEGVLADILEHSVEPPFGNQHGRPTNAHETAHGIHATFRNRHTTKARRVNAFYMGSGRVAIVDEPEFLIRDVSKHIPNCLRGYRYTLYFQDQLRYWDDRPLYVMDEWTAYVCGAETAVDDWGRLQIDTDEDSVSGSLEFSVYAVALYLTAKERKQDDDQQLKAVIQFNLTRAEAAFSAGREVFAHSGQEQIYKALQSHPDAEPIRRCLQEEFEGAFLEASK